MSHFYGTLQGGRGRASRCGTKKSGMETICASWKGAIMCRAWHDPATGEDRVVVTKMPWHGAGERKELYAGQIGSDVKGVKQ